jgi:hypothetical protein
MPDNNTKTMRVPVPKGDTALMYIPGWGETPDIAARGALALYRANPRISGMPRQKVGFIHNDTIVYVEPGDTIKSLCRRWLSQRGE